MDSSEFFLKYLPLSNGETYAYREIGISPDIILLIHGNMASSKFYDTLAQKLSKKFRVICPDMRGYGHTTYNKRVKDHQDFAEDLKLFVDDLKIPKFSILGWSTGGATASMFAAKYSEYVQYLVLLCSIEPTGYLLQKTNPDGTKEPHTEPEDISNEPFIVYYKDVLNRKDRETIKSTFDTTMYAFNKPDETRYEHYIDEILLQRNLDDIAISNHFFNLTNEDTSYSKGLNIVKNIQARTLILHGEKDIIIPPTENWLKILGGEDKAKWKVFKNCGHNPIEDCLDELANEIIDFIKVK